MMSERVPRSRSSKTSTDSSFGSSRKTIAASVAESSAMSSVVAFGPRSRMAAPREARSRSSVSERTVAASRTEVMTYSKQSRVDACAEAGVSGRGGGGTIDCRDPLTTTSRNSARRKLCVRAVGARNESNRDRWADENPGGGADWYRFGQDRSRGGVQSRGDVGCGRGRWHRQRKDDADEGAAGQVRGTALRALPRQLLQAAGRAELRGARAGQLRRPRRLRQRSLRRPPHRAAGRPTDRKPRLRLLDPQPQRCNDPGRT